MRIIFSFLALAFLFTSCDDGDVITAELSFGDTFETCGDTSLVFYKIKSDPAETLSLEMNITYEELLETETDADALLYYLVDETPTETISSSYPFYYRTYSSAVTGSIFCNAIPASNLGITNDYISTIGTANFNIVLTEDDNDGIPAEFEDDNDDGDNDPRTNPTDTDGDGIPNFLDADDDGDNVLTAVEIEFQTITTLEELELVLNTDANFTNGDNDPNYLDSDDDADGVLTINEEGFLTPDLDPTDDITDPSVGPDYLNPAVSNNDAGTLLYIEHTIEQSFLIELFISNISLSILSQDFIDFGTKTVTSSRTVTPTF
ncbi:hypothetical protein [Lacinutrix algicola]|uniref:hypothetical protein n=1 Tax=Lacinutrix algicola TaxID=342954 RepID=UPI0006E4243D|nr:hypothetical protein [Lacinutrix algicola]